MPGCLSLGTSMRMITDPTIDIAGFERWISSIPDHIDVRAWRYQGIDLWPLFKTCLVGLAILIRTGQKRRGLRTGGVGWQCAVLLDRFGISTLRRSLGSPPR